MSDDWQVVEAAFAQLGWNMTPVHTLREREAQRDEAVSRLEARVLGLIGDRNRAEVRVARLEEALREIADVSPRPVTIALTALAHEEEK